MSPCERWAMLSLKIRRRVVFQKPQECWLWNGAHIHQGYSEVSVGPRGKRRQIMAHRLMYEVFREPIPEGLQIDHLCRNRGCINPWHLETVTVRENLRRGMRTKLTPEKVADIRRRGQSQEPGTKSKLAREFGVHPSHISRIISRDKNPWPEVL